MRDGGDRKVAYAIGGEESIDKHCRNKAALRWRIGDRGEGSSSATEPALT